MKVFITGATGVLGKRLVAELANRGHDPIGLVRDEDGATLVEEHGGKPAHGDLFDVDSLSNAAENADVIVHAATNLPTKTKTEADDWKQNDRVRVEGGTTALEAAARIDADQFLTHTVVWAYRNEDGSTIDEDDAPNTDRTTASVVDVEEAVHDAGQKHGFDTTILRYGWFYGPRSGQMHNIAENLLAEDLPVIGDGLTGRRGETTISLIHTEDAARAMASAIEADASGTWNVVDTEPVSTDAFFAEFARLLDVDEPGRIPGWLAKFFVGEDMVRFLTNSFPASNDRFVEAVGWEPRYPTYRDGLESIVETWLEDGRLVVTGDGYAWGENVATQYQCRNCGRHFGANTRACPHCDSQNQRPITT
jgi:nucleoside-diphosphate-sugar epimerase